MSQNIFIDMSNTQSCIGLDHGEPWLNTLEKICAQAMKRCMGRWIPLKSFPAPGTTVSQDFVESLFAFVPEYHVDAMLELCNTLRLYMHPTVPVQQIPGIQ